MIEVAGKLLREEILGDCHCIPLLLRARFLMVVLRLQSFVEIRLKKFLAKNASLREYRSQRPDFDRSVVWHRKRSFLAIRVRTLHNDMVAFTYNNKTKALKGFDNILLRCINGELHRAMRVSAMYASSAGVSPSRCSKNFSLP